MNTVLNVIREPLIGLVIATSVAIVLPLKLSESAYRLAGEFYEPGETDLYDMAVPLPSCNSLSDVVSRPIIRIPEGKPYDDLVLVCRLESGSYKWVYVSEVEP